MKVLKFGGSSVGQPERLPRVLERIEQEARADRVAVVVSAMADGTDWLLEAVQLAARDDFAGAQARVHRLVSLALDSAAALAPEDALERLAPPIRALGDTLERLLFGVSLVRVVSPETRDLVLSFGERISAVTVAGLLEARGLRAVYVDARRWVVTDDRFGEALVDHEASRQKLEALQAELEPTAIPVHTGFLGQTPDGRTTTLGRNGSDYTASVLASFLGAHEVHVWTNVSGVMTADPDLVAEAYPVPHLSYREALELSNFGARMFHARTMIPLMSANIPLTIRNLTQPDDRGTRIDERGSPDVERPTCVTSLERLALLEIDARRILGSAPVGERILGALAERGVGVWMATQSGHGQAFVVVVSGANADRAQLAIDDVLAAEIERGDVERTRVRREVALVTLVAEAMGQSVNVAGRMFSALGRAGIPVWGIAQCASSRSISCVVDPHDTTPAVRAVHAAFNLATSQVSLLLLGVGTVGAQLLHQVQGQARKLADEQGIALRVVGVASSRRALFDESGLSLTDLPAKLEAEGNPVDLHALLDRLRRLPVPIVVDCTPADGMERVYHAAFERGIHVVGANKKPLTIDLGARRHLLSAAQRSHRFYHYETTVGASLPVIDTLMSLVRTGDRVDRVEGSFSGTLGFLSNEVMAGKKLSAAVRDAKARGYTEPHPRDDLGGVDAARKALILARELGLSVSLEDVEVEPFIPAELLEESDLELFFENLAGFDAKFSERIAGLKREGQVLRYLARIEPHAPGGPKIGVGPVAVPADHPATRLRSTEAFVAFYTERYAELPLVVQGAGAGGAVTAAGVLGDILRIAQALRGR